MLPGNARTHSCYKALPQYWVGHAFVQAEFVGRLINQRKRYPERFCQVLARHLTLRHLADYAPDTVTQLQASRTVQHARDFLAAIREEVNPHAR
jgi:hypothetical protein